MSDFHFLRPGWLLALLPILVMAWGMWHVSDATRPWRGVVAPHLLKHLMVGKRSRSSVSPQTGMMIAWCLTVLALAGPTWRREPAPFADSTTAMVIVLKVTPSMQTADVEPARLARAVEKIHDLLGLLTGSKIGLIAYSGSAHVVMPLTSDAEIIETFASELDPTVLPAEGDVAADALQLASSMIKTSGQRGWILWMADAASPDQVPLLRQDVQRELAPVSVLAVSGAGPELDSLKTAGSAVKAELVSVTPDKSDVQQLARNVRFSAAADDTGEHWRDAGYWLVPIVVAISLVWFRRGWVLPIGAVT